MKIALKLFFIHLWSVATKLCFIFSKNISQISVNGSYFWSQPKISRFLQKMSGILDPRIPTFWNSGSPNLFLTLGQINKVGDRLTLCKNEQTEFV
jgi:hypothetical protein